MAKKLGKVIIKVDGQVLTSKPGASIDIGGVQRKTQKDATGFGFAEEDMQSKCDCELNIDKNVSLAKMRNWDSVTLSFECDTGQTYVVQGAWLTNTPNMTDNEGGSCKLTFEGPPAEEML